MRDEKDRRERSGPEQVGSYLAELSYAKAGQTWRRIRPSFKLPVRYPFGSIVTDS